MKKKPSSGDTVYWRLADFEFVRVVYSPYTGCVLRAYFRVFSRRSWWRSLLGLQRQLLVYTEDIDSLRSGSKGSWEASAFVCWRSGSYGQQVTLHPQDSAALCRYITDNAVLFEDLPTTHLTKNTTPPWLLRYPSDTASVRYGDDSDEFPDTVMRSVQFGGLVKESPPAPRTRPPLDYRG